MNLNEEQVIAFELTDSDLKNVVGGWRGEHDDDDWGHHRWGHHDWDTNGYPFFGYGDPSCFGGPSFEGGPSCFGGSSFEGGPSFEGRPGCNW